MNATYLLAAERLGTVLGGTGMPGRRYTPYGALAGKGGLMLGFCGQLREPSNDGYLLGNGRRLYSCAPMRFHSADSRSPFGAGGINAYAYCVGDPVNRVDPTGEISFMYVAKQIIWLAARSKAAMSGPTGLKRVSEVAKWGARIGSGLSMLGGPIGEAVASVSQILSLGTKAVTLGKFAHKKIAGWTGRDDNPAISQKAMPSVVGGPGHFSGSVGIVFSPFDETAFSPFAGPLSMAVASEHIAEQVAAIRQ
ncbi:RHS repeat-associated core domain-containing protein [Pseudomonas putida]|uniref:RHS repeat-associated core domain-containing protein n=1 Tax=Pseudomonas putida TaxID=303 RepID=UPI0030CC8526